MKKIIWCLVVMWALSGLEGGVCDMSGLLFTTIPYGGQEYAAVVALRKEILQKPDEFISQKEEVDYIHIAGYLHEELCASALLVPEIESVKMQRVVVSAAMQRQGIGSALLRYCEQYAREHCFKVIYCYSRLETIGFYEINGYKISGNITYKNNIPHQKMTKEVQ